ncbi:DUF6515 family protein [Ohtaekwangia sp.]|uniref:DUF6515 family protein n=1 Tax=Ohtaekwangia sp. TaxID=2066019 RepID=UPI002FDCDC40
MTVVAMVMWLGSATVAEAQHRHRERMVRKHVRHRVVVRVHVTRRAHMRYAHCPRWGTFVSVVPRTAVIINRGPQPYYYSDGIYYAQRHNGFVVVRPAPGVRIRVLPVGYRAVIIRSPRPYYYYYGTFYAKADDVDEYEVVDPPVGAIVDALPDGYEVKTINNQEYYELDGVYYAEVETPDLEDGVGYEVIKI